MSSQVRVHPHSGDAECQWVEENSVRQRAIGDGVNAPKYHLSWSANLRGMGWRNWGEADIAPITCEESSDGGSSNLIHDMKLYNALRGPELFNVISQVLELTQRCKRNCAEEHGALREQMRATKYPNPQNSPSICGWSQQKIWPDSFMASSWWTSPLPPPSNIAHQIVLTFWIWYFASISTSAT